MADKGESLDSREFCPYTYHMEKRMGRPPKGGEVLAERLELRITSAEKFAYDEAATAAGMERSDWIRKILGKAAKRPLKPEKPKT
jgi:hypothetical protein